MKRRHANFLMKNLTEIPSIHTHINRLWNSFQINQIEKSQFVKFFSKLVVDIWFKNWKSEFLHWHVKISSSSKWHSLHFFMSNAFFSLNLWKCEMTSFQRLTDLFRFATVLLTLRAWCRDCYWQQPAAHKLWVAKI